MAEFKPHGYQSGDRVRHDKLNETDEAVARNNVVGGPNAYISDSVQGKSIDFEGANAEPVGYMFFIKTQVGPCQGVYPNFVFGVGTAEVMNVFADRTTTASGNIIEVCNSLPEPIVIGSWCVQAKKIGPLIFVDVAPCPVG
jgi:hypothetical protein